MRLARFSYFPKTPYLGTSIKVLGKRSRQGCERCAGVGAWLW